MIGAQLRRVLMLIIDLVASIGMNVGNMLLDAGCSKSPSCMIPSPPSPDIPRAAWLLAVSAGRAAFRAQCLPVDC